MTWFWKELLIEQKISLGVCFQAAKTVRRLDMWGELRSLWEEACDAMHLSCVTSDIDWTQEPCHV
jgi:hypothetical protein